MKMKQLLIFYSILCFIICQCSCFSIDLDSPIIYEDQANSINAIKSSYFGFSVILYPGDKIRDKPWIQIGAPRGNNPEIKYKNPGTIYRCNIGGLCENLAVDKEYGQGNTVINDHRIYYNKNLTDAWIGGAMDINLSSNRSVVCASRWINMVEIAAHPKKYDYRMQGACYWSRGDSKTFNRKLPLLTEKSPYSDVFKSGNVLIYDYGQGQSGFAVHLPKSGTEMLLGAPGVFNWKGTTYRCQDKAESTYSVEGTANVYYPRGNKRVLSDSEIFKDENIVNAGTSEHILSFSLFGYAVSSGYFYSKKILHYVSSAPRSEQYKGEVFIFKFYRQNNGKLNKIDSRKGSQYGEYFGGSVAVGDINDDGLDDLFVGAPFHHISEYNEGKIYLFLGSKKGSLQNPSQGEYVEGKQTNAQFGTAITYLGRMNHDASSTDNRRYVAIAAPYEETSGVVYIFQGTSYGMDTNPVKRIVGSIIHPYLRGFGISISKPADIDQNGYTDIAIGAHKSGHVVLLRSSPSVKFNTYFRYLPKTIPINFTDFYVTLCHECSFFKGKPLFRITNIDIQVDGALNRVHQETGTHDDDKYRNIPKNGAICRNITIRRNKSPITDYSPINIKITYSIKKEKNTGKLVISYFFNGTDRFCEDCGVYDELESKEIATADIPFVLGCKDDKICRSELEFESTFQGDGVRNNSYIQGATKVMSLITVIKNKGEKAYLLKAQVDLPQGLKFKQIPTLCEKRNDNGLICQVADPLNQNKMEILTLKLDMDSINQEFEGDHLVINVSISTSSHNRNKAFKPVVLNLTTEADISVVGKSSEQSYPYGNSAERNVSFQQIYQIAKYGRSPVHDMVFKILIPYAIKTKSRNITFLYLYQPKGSLGESKSLIFNSDITFLQENELGPAEVLENEELEVTRRRREIKSAQEETSAGSIVFLSENNTNSNKEMADFFIGNKTYDISCNMTDIICGEVSGTTGRFQGQQSVVFQLKMLLDFEALADTIKDNTIIRYSTYGTVESLNPLHLNQTGKRPDMVIVTTLFVNDANKKKIALWIIVVSIASGLLLLLFFTVGLTKAGFFERAKKEELKQLKAQAGEGDGPENNAETVTENSSAE